jgi:AraC-like DNA-binding protein
MPHGDPTLTVVAGTMAIGPRTLQRRLRDQGADFKKLVDDTRRRFALRYLGDRKNTLTEVAYLLGYSEVSAFNRAFKRWTGSTPSDYRRQAKTRPGE